MAVNFLVTVFLVGGRRSFKGWQKNAITSFLSEQNIKIGKPEDFF